MSFYKSLVSVMVFLMAFAAVANASTYTVPGWNYDPVGSWVLFANIQSAIDGIAGGWCTVPGPHTIAVASGMSENVMLYGESASPFEADLTIDGGSLGLTGSIDCSANTTGVTITNFAPITGGAFGVNCGANTTVTYNQIDNCGNGVECHSTTATVDTNEIMNCSSGVLSDSSDTATISNNLILMNDIGVMVNGASPSIDSNMNIDQNSTCGIQITGNSSPTISGNTIDQNGMDGINNSGTGTVSITSGNTITNNPNFGILFDNGTADISGGNNISDNGDSGNWQTGGILIMTSADCDIDGNTIDGNLGTGIGIVGNNNGNHVISDNDITDNNNYGIYYEVIASSDNSAITNNTVTGNGASPVVPDSTDMGMMFGDGTPECSGNTITNNTGEGVGVVGTANPDFGDGALSSVGNNVIHSNDSGDDDYDFNNSSTNDIYAKNNNWGSATNGQMSGSYFNTTDIDPAIYDNWENGSLGYVRWSDGDPSSIKSASLGTIKAEFANGLPSGAMIPIKSSK